MPSIIPRLPVTLVYQCEVCEKQKTIISRSFELVKEGIITYDYTFKCEECKSTECRIIAHCHELVDLRNQEEATLMVDIVGKSLLSPHPLWP